MRYNKANDAHEEMILYLLSMGSTIDEIRSAFVAEGKEDRCSTEAIRRLLSRGVIVLDDCFNLHIAYYSYSDATSSKGDVVPEGIDSKELAASLNEVIAGECASIEASWQQQATDLQLLIQTWRAVTQPPGIPLTNDELSSVLDALEPKIKKLAMEISRWVCQ